MNRRSNAIECDRTRAIDREITDRVDACVDALAIDGRKRRTSVRERAKVRERDDAAARLPWLRRKRGDEDRERRFGDDKNMCVHSYYIGRI